jgi:phosphate acetyltransferase
MKEFNKQHQKLLKEKYAKKIIILGKKEDILKTAELKQYEGKELEIINPEDEKNKYFDDFAKTFYELRKHKGITIESAKEQIKDRNNFGALFVKKDIVDGMVSGSSCPTGDVLR